MQIGINLSITGTIVLTPPPAEEPGGGLGPEWIVNGDFSAGSTGWNITNLSGATQVEEGYLMFHDPGDEGDSVNQDTGTMEVGHTYRLKFDVLSRTGGAVAVTMSGALAPLINAVGPYEADLVAATNTGILSFTAQVPNNIVIDNVSIKEVL